MLSQQTGISPLSIVPLIISLIAVSVSIITWRSNRKENVYQYLSSLWNDTLTSCLANPAFLDSVKTEDYQRKLSDEERSRYDVYCYKAWSQVEEIVAKGFHGNPQFKAIIAWNTAYNGQWIRRNPAFFTSTEFWEVIDELRNAPQIILGHRPLPKKDDDIDWDEVCDDYHNFILSPFAPEMVDRDPATGAMRNQLLDELLALPWGALRSARLADFGCGPGNLIAHLGGRVEQLTGIDKSGVALDRAAKVASDHGIRFDRVEADFRNIQLNTTFDLIVSSNSILPPADRRDVIRILEVIKNHLRPGGRFYGILPAYDATLYLQSLWLDHYTKMTGDRGHANRIVEAFREGKLADDERCSYADDGHNPQCYHTPETIGGEFYAAGLRLLREPMKIRYPWKLANRFDYGYFPDAPEEIWDWFVVAEAIPPRLS